jgi:hypothetical protein
LVVPWRPVMRYNSGLARLCDGGRAIAGPMLALIVWVNRDSWPLWGMAVCALAGLWATFVGLYIIRTGQSFSPAATTFFVDPGSMTRETAAQSAWMAWLHARLPDPERQKAHTHPAPIAASADVRYLFLPEVRRSPIPSSRSKPDRVGANQWRCAASLSGPHVPRVGCIPRLWATQS